MISIIICSKKADISDALRQNIKKTVGVPFELIVIDNSENKYSIFEAYNTGITRASFNNLCFVHEDVSFHTNNWGEKAVDHLSDEKTGLIGLAGAFYLLNVPSPWFRAKPCIKNLIQSAPSGDNPGITHIMKGSPKQEVAGIDGFCFFSRKDVFQYIKYDSETFKGFHFYDLDISLQARKEGYNVYVVSNILMEHFSYGSLNLQWLESSLLFYDKWKYNYPIRVNATISKRFLGDTIAFRDLLFIANRSKAPSLIKKKINQIGWEQLRLNVITGYLLYFFKYLQKKKKSDVRYVQATAINH